MSAVKVYYAPDQFLGKFWNNGSNVSASEFEKYRFICSVQDVYGGEQAAERMFGLSNNPNDETSRYIYFGDNRSLSSGDIVEVDSVKYLCLSFGWKILDH